MYKSLAFIALLVCALAPAFAANSPIRRVQNADQPRNEHPDNQEIYNQFKVRLDNPLDQPHGSVLRQPNSVEPTTPAREVTREEDLDVKDLNRIVRPFQLRDPIPLITDENRPIGVPPGLPNAHAGAEQPISHPSGATTEPLHPIERPIPVEPEKPTLVNLTPVVLPDNPPNAPDDQPSDTQPIDLDNVDTEKTPNEPVDETKDGHKKEPIDDEKASTDDEHGEEQYDDDGDDDDDDEEEESSSSSSSSSGEEESSSSSSSSSSQDDDQDEEKDESEHHETDKFTENEEHHEPDVYTGPIEPAAHDLEDIRSRTGGVVNPSDLGIDIHDDEELPHPPSRA